ncbi:hypothetical protein [Pseudomonas fitomaticsae]|uniref:Uncharacterized protein n=1 Tax=Pseudomonas fitomaticsae TaxID=2837969 RepID=A0ABY3PY74_9PSED|nr:hypothetical protein [Pseudomonas fitomaticsae]UFP98745.1 hypothetical protein KJY40_22255 [Pseudomonas fitomaticsae]
MYIPASYNKHSKVFYRPVEAALRWCNLVAHETIILKESLTWPSTLHSTFPQWPCLHKNLDLIYDAIDNGELAYGWLGVTVSPGTKIDPALVTIRHNDLKLWMSIYHPDHRPSFLFFNIPSNSEAISIESYLALQADRDASRLKLEAIEQTYQSLLKDLQSVGLEKEKLSQLLNSKKQVSDRTEIVYLHIIGALLNLLLGRTPAGKPHSVFQSQAAIVDNLTAYHSNCIGITKRTLDEKFAAAKRSLSQN